MKHGRLQKGSVTGGVVLTILAVVWLFWTGELDPRDVIKYPKPVPLDTNIGIPAEKQVDPIVLDPAATAVVQYFKP